MTALKRNAALALFAGGLLAGCDSAASHTPPSRSAPAQQSYSATDQAAKSPAASDTAANVKSPAQANEVSPEKPVPPNAAPDGQADDSQAAPPATTGKPDSAAGKPAPAARPASVDENGVVDASFDDIKFEMVKGDPFERAMLTPKIEGLFGKRMRIRGFMFPTNFKSGLRGFVLVRDNMECCFGPGAALFDCIVVEMAGDRTTDYHARMIAVEGTFTFSEFIGPDGKHLAIYHLAAEKVE